MAEYIKLEDAEQEICRFIGYLDEDMIARLKIAIRKIRTADVRENVRGEWKYRHVNRSTAPITLKVKCDKCGAERDRLVGDVLNYCHNCGADMRGDSNA